uniref:WD repeat and coiled-coil-containing protein n=1 Tax=Geotrypetes seraphini TaxID=260995 RepID=A0A6P8R7S6_GEOSA|nr:WD repeat and coiled-coil-containing protein [Geotrypetes seraphini]XP_033794776.1 WD repeat and coiled-coil-containing protein [Geotrypetes seraphini]
MELGKAKLLRTGLNSLFQAIHPVHGLAWTDGRQVMLTALHLHNEHPKFGDSTVIGQFEHVHGLYWGPAGSADAPSLLAIQHKKHVTVWHLYYNILENIKLMVSQTCEISEPFPVLPQGCVWHPKNDVLAVLTKRNASVFYNVRYDNSSIKADVKCSSFIHCACWTKGNRLVVAAGSALHSYIWDKAQKTLNPCSFCPIFDVGSYVCAIESTGGSQVAIATELPLYKICSLNASNAFDIPDGPESNSAQPNLLVKEEILRATGEEESRNVNGVKDSPGPVDLTHILANSEKSDSNTLFHLIRKDLLTGSGQDSSHVILVTLEQKVTSTRKISIPGILVPDILAFDPTAHIVAVASNTYSTILVYSLFSSSMPIQKIHLEKKERPKGLCFLTNKTLLILVGTQKYCDSAFPPSSCSDKYIVRLVVKEVICEEDSSASSRCQNACMRTIAHKVHFENFSRDDQAMKQEPSKTDCTDLPSGREQTIKEEKAIDYEQNLTSDSKTLGEKSLPFNMETDEEPKIQTGDQLDVLSEMSNVCNNNNLLVNQEIYRTSSNWVTTFSRIAGGQQEQSLPEITDSVQTKKTLSLDYPSFSDPPFVYIRFQKKILSGIALFGDTRSVLLCHGKLRLNVVQELYKIQLVEMQQGSSWIVLTTDSDGFIPLIFKDKQEIIIREPNARLED